MDSLSSGRYQRLGRIDTLIYFFSWSIKMSFSKKIALFSTSVVTFFLFVVPSAFAQDGGAVAQQAANAVAELDKTAATGGMNLIAAAPGV